MAHLDNSSPSKIKTDTSQIPLAEWIVSGIGLLMVGVVIAYLGYTALTQDASPPDIQVEIISVKPIRQGYLAQFRATNLGGLAASNVHIQGEYGEGPDKEQSQAVVDFLPAGSEKSGGLFFIHQPPIEQLHVRAMGYQEP
jgi:uncharacterized protein (TIGR02588 family)